MLLFTCLYTWPASLEKLSAFVKELSSFFIHLSALHTLIISGRSLNLRVSLSITSQKLKKNSVFQKSWLRLHTSKLSPVVQLLYRDRYSSTDSTFYYILSCFFIRSWDIHNSWILSYSKELFLSRNSRVIVHGTFFSLLYDTSTIYHDIKATRYEIYLTVFVSKCALDNEFKCTGGIARKFDGLIENIF